MDKQVPQNHDSNFLCQPNLQPATNDCRNACSLLPPGARLPKIRSLQSCADQYAIRRRENAAAPLSSARLPTPSVLSVRRGKSHLVIMMRPESGLIEDCLRCASATDFPVLPPVRCLCVSC